MRFYVSPESVLLEKDIIEVKDRQEVHHIRDVMRLAKGLSVTVFDGTGKEYKGRIKKIDKVSVAIDIVKIMDSDEDQSLCITLYQAIPKKTKMDFIVEKAAELGVSRIVPLITERTIPDVKDKSVKKRARWDRIAKAASKQCGRGRLPEISDIMSFENSLLESKKNDLVLFAALDKDAIPLKRILKDKNFKGISIFVGPEGDFSEKEIMMARDNGYRICSLGDLVLRVETAALYVLSCLNYEYRN